VTERPDWYDDAPFRFKNVHGEHWAARIVDGRLELTGLDVGFKVWSPPPPAPNPDWKPGHVPSEMRPPWVLTDAEATWARSVLQMYVEMMHVAPRTLEGTTAWSRWR
jgi:hypothetical protein